VRHLSSQAFSRTEGARKVRSTIQKLVADELAKRIIEGKLKSGRAITVGAKKGEIVYA
jgi:ATP-dependent Clp protease ATP-binding subunit ClpA